MAKKNDNSGLLIAGIIAFVGYKYFKNRQKPVPAGNETAQERVSAEAIKSPARPPDEEAAAAYSANTGGTTASTTSAKVSSDQDSGADRYLTYQVMDVVA